MPLVLLLNVFLGANVYAQVPKVEVKATVDKKSIDPSDVVVLSVSINSEEDVDAKPPTLPPMSDFEVQNQWQGKTMSANLINTPTGPQFKTVRSTVYNWQLAPKKLGALTIFPIEVVVGGRSLRTSTLVVTVASGAGGQRGNVARNGRGTAKPPPGFDDDDALPGQGQGDDEEDLFSQLLRRGMRPVPQQQGGSRSIPHNPNEAFFIQVETDKTEAYVGEQITVSFYLYTTGMIRDLDTLKYPALKGFWKEDIEIATHLNFQQEVVD